MFSSTENDWNLLLRDTKSGDQGALNSLLSQLAVTLRPILQSRLRGWRREDQDDVLQETLITVAQKITDIQSHPHRYALVVLRHKIGDALRSQRGKIRVSLDYLDEPETHPLRRDIRELILHAQTTDDFESAIVGEDLIHRIRSALTQLSIFCQTFFLGLMEQRSSCELWDYFHALEPRLQPGAYRKRLFDCRVKLKALLQESP